jgi:hypothetical protein
LGDRVNLRAQPVEDAEVVGQMMAGDLLVAPDPLASNAWVRVVAPQSVDLWVYGELLQAGRIAVNKAQVRGGPGLQFKRVGELNKGTTVVSRGEMGDWTKIAPTDACFLWINRDYVAPVIPVVAEEANAAVPLPEAPPPADDANATGAATDLVPPAILAPLAEANAAGDATDIVQPAVLAPLPDETAPAQPAPATPKAISRPFQPILPSPPIRTPTPTLPLALNGFVPDARRPQNAPGKFSGTLIRVNYAAGPGFSTHQIVASGRGRSRREVLCQVIGLDGQLAALVDSPVEVQGRIWHLAGQDVPVLEARRLLALPARQ